MRKALALGAVVFLLLIVTRIPAGVIPSFVPEQSPTKLLRPEGTIWQGRGELLVDLANLFVDPAVDFGLQFHATVADMAPTPTEDPDNDEMEQGDGVAVGKDDGSNVVTVDFGRKK